MVLLVHGVVTEVHLLTIVISVTVGVRVPRIEVHSVELMIFELLKVGEAIAIEVQDRVRRIGGVQAVPPLPFIQNVVMIPVIRFGGLGDLDDDIDLIGVLLSIEHLQDYRVDPSSFEGVIDVKLLHPGHELTAVPEIPDILQSLYTVLINGNTCEEVHRQVPLIHTVADIAGYGSVVDIFYEYPAHSPANLTPEIAHGEIDLPFAVHALRDRPDDQPARDGIELECLCRGVPLQVSQKVVELYLIP